MCILRWDTGDEKISTFAWGRAYAHRSSLDKLGPYTEAETSDSFTLLERVIKVINIGKRVYGMHGALEVSDSV